MKKGLLVFLGLFGACLYANETMYTSSVKNLFEDSNTTSVKGRLLPTSKVKILEKQGNKVKIEIEGYIKDNISYAIYFSKGKRILVTGLSKNTKFDFKTISTSKDENEVEWKKVSFTAYTKNENFTKDLDSLYKKAYGIYTENCAMCHLAHPTSEFTANQWPSIVKSMISRTAMTKEQNYLVTQYLQKHAKDMKKGE